MANLLNFCDLTRTRFSARGNYITESEDCLQETSTVCACLTDPVIEKMPTVTNPTPATASTAFHEKLLMLCDIVASKMAAMPAPDAAAPASAGT
jgi:hypothetical protein